MSGTKFTPPPWSPRDPHLDIYDPYGTLSVRRDDYFLALAAPDLYQAAERASRFMLAVDTGDDLEAGVRSDLDKALAKARGEKCGDVQEEGKLKICAGCGDVQEEGELKKIPKWIFLVDRGARCARCGTTATFDFPMPVRDFIARNEEFGAAHAKCPAPAPIDRDKVRASILAVGAMLEKREPRLRGMLSWSDLATDVLGEMDRR